MTRPDEMFTTEIADDMRAYADILRGGSQPSPELIAHMCECIAVIAQRLHLHANCAKDID